MTVKLEHTSPFFIVANLTRAVTYYEDALGFAVQVYLKEVSEDAAPNPNCTQHPWARWDAFIHLADPDSLARELSTREVEFRRELADTDDGLRGFEVADADGYVLFFGRPK